MMKATLTGQEASEALRVYAWLGSMNARFDGRKVAQAVQDSRARARLAAAIAFSRVSARVTRGAVALWAIRPRARTSRCRPVASRRLRRSAARTAPGRPAAPGDPAQAGSVAHGEAGLA